MNCMNAFSEIFLVALFCVLQIVFMKKASKKWLKYLPTVIGGVGVGIGTVIYYISYIPFLLNMNSQSVLSENQYFALTICILFMPGLIGALMGIVLAWMSTVYTGQVINIELPLGLVIIVFFLGCGKCGFWRR